MRDYHDGNVRLPTTSISTRHRNAHHSNGGRKGSHGSPYHLYLNSMDVRLKDMAAFEYVNFKQLVAQNEDQVLFGDEDSLCMSQEKVGAGDKAFRNTITVI